VKVVVDLNRCQGYGQCVYAAPNIFQLKGVEILAYDPAPSDQWRDEVERGDCPRPGSLLTRRWRDMDSNFRFRGRALWF
jgi:ferredoxin